jgi:hypothetical protein
MHSVSTLYYLIALLDLACTAAFRGEEVWITKPFAQARAPAAATAAVHFMMMIRGVVQVVKLRE